VRGLTAASRNLNVPKSTVSYRLQQLEASLGIRLINRTPRSLSTTDAGDLSIGMRSRQSTEGRKITILHAACLYI
jgi:DNA-binding transcriptional LysR family regulator